MSAAPARSPCGWCQGFKRIVREYKEDRGVVSYTYDCPRCATPAAPVESVRPARTAREVAHEAVSRVGHCVYGKKPANVHGVLCNDMTEAIERDRRGRTGEPGAADEAARILRGVQAYARTAMVPSGEVDAWLASYDATPSEAQKEPR